MKSTVTIIEVFDPYCCQTRFTIYPGERVYWLKDMTPSSWNRFRRVLGTPVYKSGSLTRYTV